MDKSSDLFRSEKPEHDDVSPRVLYLSHRQPGKKRKASRINEKDREAKVRETPEERERGKAS